MELRGLIFGFVFAMFVGAAGFYIVSNAVTGSGQTPQNIRMNETITQYTNDLNNDTRTSFEGLKTAGTPGSIDQFSILGAFTSTAYSILLTVWRTFSAMFSVMTLIPEELQAMGLPSFAVNLGVAFAFISISLTVVLAFVSFLRGYEVH